MSTSPVLRRFMELEQHLCRIENRVNLFRGPDTSSREHGHHALAGKVLAETYEFLKSLGLLGIPTRQALADQIHVHANQITDLFKGKPPKRRNWCRECGGLLAYLLQEVIQANCAGLNDDALAQLDTIRRRIQHYFFRSVDSTPKDRIPSFFAFERRFTGYPCSLQELSHEVAWFARQPEVGAFRTEIVVILGGILFPPHDPRGLVLARLREAVLAGVQVTFIRHGFDAQANGTSTPEKFQNEFKDVRGKFQCFEALPDGVYEVEGEKRRVADPLSAAALPLASAPVLCMRSVTHGRKPNDGDDQEVCVHLQLRNFSPVYPPPDHDAVAHPATQADLEAFREWRLNWRSDPTTNAVPAPSEPSTGGESPLTGSSDSAAPPTEQ
jgi:hypothetical protein